MGQLSSLDAFENLVFLCIACHAAFNNPALVWIFLPASLDDFIASEEAFQAQCRSGAPRGQSLPRLPATAATPDLLYARYQIRTGVLFSRIFTDTPTSTWPGSPLAAIIRSVRALSVFERVPVRDGGLPMNVALKLQQLLLLYGTPELELAVRPQGAPATLGGTSPDDRESQIVLRVQPEAETPMDPGEDSPPPFTDPNQDPAFVGRAFNSALQYIHNRWSNQNMTPAAHAWLMAELPLIMDQLKRNLRKLHDHRDSPINLPEYAIDRSIPLHLCSSTIPRVLVPYGSQLLDCILRLLKSCDLNATCTLVTAITPFILCKITFAPGVSESDSQTMNRIFDPDLENKFATAVQALSLEPT